MSIDKDDSNSSVTSKNISPGGLHSGTGLSTSTSSSSHPQHHQTAIDITAADLIGKLSIGNVVDLVLVSMLQLPEKMPASFQATYTPIAAAGTPAQIEHLARLLGAQLTAAGYGKGYELMRSQQVEKKIQRFLFSRFSMKKFIFFFIRFFSKLKFKSKNRSKIRNRFFRLLFKIEMKILHRLTLTSK